MISQNSKIYNTFKQRMTFMWGKLLLTAIGAVLGWNLNAGTMHCWEFKEGSGNTMVRDTLGGLTARLNADGKTAWAREDDRGAFLNFIGGTVTVPHHDSLLYPNGFIARIRFSATLDPVAANQWMGLFSKGSDQNSGYTAMLKSDGSALLIGLKGMTPSRLTLPLKINSNRDYELVIAIGGGKTHVGLNGTPAAEFSVSGILGDSGGMLYIGTLGNCQFSGNIYKFSIEPWTAARLNELIVPKTAVIATPGGQKFPALNLADPPGTVKITDFTKFTPPPVVGDINNGLDWFFRSEAHFIAPDAGVLHPKISTDAHPLEFDPKLNGTYDLYIGTRSVDTPTAIAIGLGDQWSRIDIPAEKVDSPHWSMEQVVIRNVEMKGRKIVLSSLWQPFYLGYLKFIPSDKRRAIDYPAFPGYKVTKISRPDIAGIQAALSAEANAKIAAGNFIERHYLEKVPMPALSAETLKRKFMVFPRNWMNLLFKNSMPEKDEDHVRLSATGTPGETLLVALGVRSLEEALNAEIKIENPLHNADGVLLPATIVPSVVRFARKRTTAYMGDSEFMILPYYLEPGNTIRLLPRETREFIMTLKLADTAQAGRYDGVITVTGRNQSVKIAISVKVYNFKLDELGGCDIGFWNTLTKSVAAATVARQAAYGVNAMVVNSEDALKFSGSTVDTISINWEESSLPIVAAEMKRHGMNGRLFLGSSGIWKHTLRLPAADREAGYARLIKQIISRAQREAWPKLTFNSVDEVLSSPSELPTFVKEVKWQKKLGLTTADNHIWYKTSRPYQREVDEISPCIDIFIDRFNTRRIWYVDDWENMMATAREHGVELIAYNSNNALTCSQPAAMRFLSGWFFRTPLGNGCSGQLIWAWHQGSGSPLDDLDGIDWVYLIPPYQNCQGGPILDLLGLQAGVTDLRYIQTLENAIRRAKAAGKNISEAEKLLSSLSESFDCRRFKRESVYFDSKWSEQFEQNNKRYASGSLNIPNGWTLDQYDISRAKIADAIETLNRN